MLHSVSSESSPRQIEVAEFELNVRAGYNSPRAATGGVAALVVRKATNSRDL